MNRFFWKFFAGLLLAQLMTTAFVVSFIWFKDVPHLRQLDDRPSAMRGAALAPDPPPPALRVDAPPGPPPMLPPPEHRGPRFPMRAVVIGFFTSLLFAYLLARHFSKPIAVLKQGFHELGTGHFDYRVSAQLEGRRDELADLGRAFDQTAVQLHRLIDSQKRLLHDVSHEVRSPLARMQLAIDLLEQQPERQFELLQRIGRESVRINALMDEVLTLARLETAVAWPMNDQIDLVELLKEVASDVRFEAVQKPCQLNLDLPEAPVLVQGNAELLHRALENVLRNAIRYTAINSLVRVSVDEQAASWCIEIDDEGPGIPEARLTHVFEPFVRVGQNADKQGMDHSGYGLGLAIAAQTVKMHSGLISATNRVHQDGRSGLCVRMTLPKN